MGREKPSAWYRQCDIRKRHQRANNSKPVMNMQCYGNVRIDGLCYMYGKISVSAIALKHRQQTAAI